MLNYPLFGMRIAYYITVKPLKANYRGVMMRSENIKVAIWGFGAMGSGMAKMLLTKKGVDIVGVCDRNPARVGKSIYELLGVERGNRPDVIVNPEIDEVISEKSCDICLTATDSFTAKAFPRT